MTKKFTKICIRILSVISLIFAFIYINSLFHINKGTIFYVNLLLGITTFIIAYGLWYLKRWTLYLYFLTSLSFHIFSLINDSWEPTLLIWPITYIFLISINYKNLT